MTKYVKVIRYLFIFVLFSSLLYWFGGGFAKPGAIGLLNDTIFGALIFIILVINCVAGILVLNDKKHEELSNRMTLFTLLIFITLPVIIMGLKSVLESQLF